MKTTAESRKNLRECLHVFDIADGPPVAALLDDFEELTTRSEELEDRIARLDKWLGGANADRDRHAAALATMIGKLTEVERDRDELRARLPDAEKLAVIRKHLEDNPRTNARQILDIFFSGASQPVVEPRDEEPTEASVTASDNALRERVMFRETRQMWLYGATAEQRREIYRSGARRIGLDEATVERLFPSHPSGTDGPLEEEVDWRARAFALQVQVDALRTDIADMRDAASPPDGTAEQQCDEHGGPLRDCLDKRHYKPIPNSRPDGTAGGFPPPTWEFVDGLRNALSRIADDAPEHISIIARNALSKRPPDGTAPERADASATAGAAPERAEWAKRERFEGRWLCDYCGVSNADSRRECGQCTCPRRSESERAAEVAAVLFDATRPPDGMPGEPDGVNVLDEGSDTFRHLVAAHGRDEALRRAALCGIHPAAAPPTVPGEPRPHRLTWSGIEWVAPCGCRYHPDDDKGTHGGAPHIHPCVEHGGRNG